MKISMLCIIALALTIYVGGFQLYRDGPLNVPLNQGVVYRYWYGFPFPYIEEGLELIPVLQNVSGTIVEESIRVSYSRFWGVFFICDWLLFTFFGAIIIEAYDRLQARRKRRRREEAEAIVESWKGGIGKEK